LLTCQPKSLTDALKLMDLETVLSSGTRAVSAGAAPALVTSLTRLKGFESLPLDVCDDLTVPPAAPHPLVSRLAGRHCLLEVEIRSADDPMWGVG
jgi:hypothetical protein